MSKENKRLRFVVAGLMLGMFMAAMDQTIVSTAMATIVSDLGGLDKFVWVTSAYLVTEMAGMPIFGKLSDMYGRKRFFVFGLTAFLIGSILCGTAHSIVQLSIYRAIQGIGGGALMPIAFTIVFDVFPPEKRGKMGGLFGAVFGLSSIIGPLLGAFITDNWNWHWVFYINVPLGILAVIFIAAFYHESREHREQKIDWWGAATLVAAIVCLMFALELGGKKYAWDSTTIIGLFAGFAVFFAIFLFIETKAEEPIISFKMFKNRLFAVSNLLGIFYGAGFIVPVVFIPIFVQGVFGGTATNSGLILLPMLLGNVVASMTGGMLAPKMSYRSIMMMSGLLFLIGMVLLSTLSADTPRFVVTLFMIITGLGVGASFSVVGIAAIHSFDPQQYGAVNSTVAFIRSLAMTVSITIYGTIQSHLMVDKLAKIFAGMRGGTPIGNLSGDPRQMLSPEARAHIPPMVLNKLTDVLSTSIAHTFMWAIIPAALALITGLFFGKARMVVSQAFSKPSQQG